MFWLGSRAIIWKNGIHVVIACLYFCHSSNGKHASKSINNCLLSFLFLKEKEIFIIAPKQTLEGSHLSAIARDIHPFPQPNSATVLSLKIESGCLLSPSKKVKDQSSGTKMLGITIEVNFFLPLYPAYSQRKILETIM